MKINPDLKHLNCSSVDPGFTVGLITSAKTAVLVFLMVGGLAKLLSFALSLAVTAFLFCFGCIHSLLIDGIKLHMQSP